MPFLGDRVRRSSRPSSTSKPLSQSPAVRRSTSPFEAKKSSNASKAHLRPPRRQEAIAIPQSISRSSGAKESATKAMDTKHVDVFDFMEHTEEEEDHEHTDDEHEDDDVVESTGIGSPTSSPVSAHHPSSHYSDLEVSADQQSKRQTWHGGFTQAGSFHSDSGISMGSSSGDGASPVLQHKYPSIRRPSAHEPSIPEDNGLNVSCQPFLVQTPAFSGDAWPPISAIPKDGPETYYARPSREAPRGLDHTTFQLPVTPPELSPQLPRGKKQPRQRPAKDDAAIKHGYSRLASNISSQEDAVIKPVYRKFETLNNRILLYLQDEISELEAELEELDVAIAYEEHCMGRHRYPASRRAEAKAPSRLQWLRNGLMDRCASKIDTYNRTLTSYSNLTQTLSPSSNSDIKTYQKWIKERNLIAEPEDSFLKRRNDLITVSQNRHHAAPTSLKYSPVTVALTILTTIIVFKFVPQFFARLMMSAVIGLALMCMVSPSSLMDLQALKEKKRAVGVYAAVMLMLAIVVD